jgi:imidazolonepropionase
VSERGARWAIAAGRVVTCDAARAGVGDALGVVEDGVVVVGLGRVIAVLPRAELAERYADAALVADAPDAVITPGLVDAHTHAPWFGSRDGEYAVRMAGGDYEAIAAAGGGIVASMRAVRAATPAALAGTLAARVARMAALGVTTVECKSGYGLDEASERKQLEAVADVASRPAAPRLVPTYLALHALPPEANGDRAAYARTVQDAWLPGIAASGLARFVDAYIDRAAFSAEVAAPVLRRARELGLGVRVHVGQFADVGGAELAADLGAASVDHLEHIEPAGIARLAASGARAVLLPVASFTLGQAPPPVAALRAAGVPLCVASDANPGTAPTESLPLALALAVRAYGLRPEEALLGATREAAASLGLGDETGVLAPGRAADLVLWDLPHERALVQPWGVPRARRVYRAGARIAGSDGADGEGLGGSTEERR